MDAIATTAAAPVATVSASVKIGAQDRRCRYWAKVLRAGQALPIPSAVSAANDVTSPYLKAGDEELMLGDVLIEGEEVSHRKARGWVYRLTFVQADGTAFIVRPKSEVKAAMKAAGLQSHLLAGSGDVAACVRIAHGLRAGLADVIAAADPN